MTGTVLVTEALLEKGKSAKGGWTRAQTILLGEPWPLARGWKRRVVGREIPRVDAERFAALGTSAGAAAAQAEFMNDAGDEALLRAAVSHLGVIARRRQPRWAVARDLFSLGSTSAAKLCLRFGFDPDSIIGPSEWELVERAVCGEGEELTVERWDEIFPGIEPPPEHDRR